MRIQFASLLQDAEPSPRAAREFASLVAWLERLPTDHAIGEFSAGLLLRACREQPTRLASSS